MNRKEIDTMKKLLIIQKKNYKNKRLYRKKIYK